MLKAKITPIGNSMGIILPKEALHKMKAEKGDTLYLVEDSQGYSLTPYQEDFNTQIQVAEKIPKCIA